VVVVYSILKMAVGMPVVLLVTLLGAEDKHFQRCLLKQQLMLVGFEI
jgi:hypothetical protein